MTFMKTHMNNDSDRTTLCMIPPEHPQSRSNITQMRIYSAIQRVAIQALRDGYDAFSCHLILGEEGSTGMSRADVTHTHNVIIRTGGSWRQKQHYPVCTLGGVPVDKENTFIVPSDEKITVTGPGKFSDTHLLIPQDFWVLSADHMALGAGVKYSFPKSTTGDLSIVTLHFIRTDKLPVIGFSLHSSDGAEKWEEVDDAHTAN